MINVDIQRNADFNFLTFDIPGGVCSPGDLNGLSALVNDIVCTDDFAKGFVISGRGPVWVFATIAHDLHPARWVATHDPRIGGGVVVSTHTLDMQVGQVLDLKTDLN